MKIHTIRFPGYMERCSGFTIPNNGVFYALYFDDFLARFDVFGGTAEEIDGNEWIVRDESSVFEMDGREYPFVGYAGIHAIHRRDGLGYLSVDPEITFIRPDGATMEFRFSNCSGDWQQTTFDVTHDGFLFGAPYDVDFKYVDLAAVDPTFGLEPESLEKDRVAARDGGITFQVCSKSGQGQRWTTAKGNIRDLLDAFHLASQLESRCWQVGILTAGKREGIIYWTTARPYLLNSAVVTRPVD